MKTWEIAYTIYAGQYDYNDYFTRELDADRLDEAAAAGLIADRWGITDPGEREGFLREFREEGYASLPGGSRAISDLGWGPVSPIIITVRNGFVEAVTGVPEEVTVEVRDWDHGELDDKGEAVPTVSEWTGPL